MGPLKGLIFLWLCSAHVVTVRCSTDGLIALIQKEAEKLGTENTQFAQDVQLTQTVVGEETTYSRGDKGGSLVFKRKGSDEGKAVVVLNSGEDHLPHTEDKRTFVVLRQSAANPKSYHVFYAYIRDVTTETPDAVDVDGSKRFVEFDIYDHRGHRGNEAFTFGWEICHSSSFVPCRTVDADLLGEIKVTETEEADYPDEDIKNAPVPLPKFKAVTSSGYSVASNYDLFADLDDDALRALFFGRTIRATAIAETILQAAKPTLHVMFKKLAPAIDPMVGAETPPIAPTGKVDLPAIATKAKAVSSIVSQVAQEFIQQLGAVGLLSNPLYATNKNFTTETGIIIGTTILKGLLNINPYLGTGVSLVNPNPSLLMDQDVLSNMVGGEAGNGPLAVAIQMQENEETAIQNLFQKQAGLSGIFDEQVVKDITDALVPVLTGQVTLPKLPALFGGAAVEVQTSSATSTTQKPAGVKSHSSSKSKSKPAERANEMANVAQKSAKKFASGNMHEKSEAAEEAATGIFGILHNAIKDASGMDYKTMLGGGKDGSQGSSLLGGHGLDAVLHGLTSSASGKEGLLGGAFGKLTSGGNAGSGLLGLGGAFKGKGLGGVLGRVMQVGKTASSALSPSAPSSDGEKPKKKFGFFRRSVENTFDILDDRDISRAVRTVVDDILILDLDADNSAFDDAMKTMNPEFEDTLWGMKSEMFNPMSGAGSSIGVVVGSVTDEVRDSRPEKSLKRRKRYAPSWFKRDDDAEEEEENEAFEQPISDMGWEERESDGYIHKNRREYVPDVEEEMPLWHGQSENEEFEEQPNEMFSEDAENVGFNKMRRWDVEEEMPAWRRESVAPGEERDAMTPEDADAETGEDANKIRRQSNLPQHQDQPNGPSGLVSSTVDGLGQTLGGVGSGVGGLLSQTVGGVGSGLGAIVEGDAVGGVANILNGVTGGVFTAGSHIGGGLWGLGSGLGSGLLSAVAGIGNTVGSIGEGVVGRRKREVSLADTVAATQEEGQKMQKREDSETTTTVKPEEEEDSSTTGPDGKGKEPHGKKHGKKHHQQPPPPPPPPSLLGGLGGLLGRKRRAADDATTPSASDSTTAAPGEATSTAPDDNKDTDAPEEGKPHHKKKKHKKDEKNEAAPALPHKQAPTSLLGGLGHLLGKRRRRMAKKASSEEETVKVKLDPTSTDVVASGPPADTKVSVTTVTEVVRPASKPKPTLLGGLGALLGKRRRRRSPKGESSEENASKHKVETTVKTGGNDSHSETRITINEKEVQKVKGNGVSLLGAVGGLLGRRRRTLEQNDEDDNFIEQRRHFIAVQTAQGEFTSNPEAYMEKRQDTGSGALLQGLLGANSTSGALHNLLSSGGNSTGLLSGLGSVHDLLHGLAGAGGLLGTVKGGLQGGSVGLFHGLTGGRFGPNKDDESFSSMAQDAAATAVADKLLGEDGQNPTLVGQLTSQLGRTLDGVLPTGGMMSALLGKGGGLIDNTFGLASKKVAGGLAKEVIKGTVRGSMDAQGMGRRKRSAPPPPPKGITKTNAELFVILGWMGADSQAFLGFGPCPKPDISAYSKIDGLDQEAAITFYLSILRVQCLDSKVTEVKDLLTKKYLELSPDKYFVVPADLAVLKKRKLSTEETHLLSRALELSSFSQVIVAEQKKEGKPELSDILALNATTSPATVTMMRFALRFLTQTKAVAPSHFVKLSRHMVRTLKTFLTKWTQDFFLASFSSKSSALEKQASFENVFHVAGLIHFYVNGLHPIQSGQPVLSTWEEFYKANDHEIYKRALLYCNFES